MVTGNYVKGRARDSVSHSLTPPQTYSDKYNAGARTNGYLVARSYVATCKMGM